MLIHVGGAEFIHSEGCVGIFNFSTLHPETQKTIRQTAGNQLPDHFRSAILKRDSKWVFSVISSESLIGRSSAEEFESAWYLRPKKILRKKKKT